MTDLAQLSEPGEIAFALCSRVVRSPKRRGARPRVTLRPSTGLDWLDVGGLNVGGGVDGRLGRGLPAAVRSVNVPLHEAAHDPARPRCQHLVGEWTWAGTRTDGTPLDMCGVTILEIEDGLSTGGNLYMAELEREDVGIAETEQKLTGRLPDQPVCPADRISWPQAAEGWRRVRLSVLALCRSWRRWRDPGCSVSGGRSGVPGRGGAVEW